MARRKLRMPSPSPPPPTPPREEPSSDDEAEAEAATPATQKAPQNPSSSDSSDGGEEEESSDSETDANAFQLAPSTAKPSESGAAADEEEDSSSSESPEPIGKKARGKKPKAEAGKKSHVADSTPSGGKAKKAKADVEKPAATPSEPNADSSDGGEEESSDSKADAYAFNLREVVPSSSAEDGSSSETPEPIIQKKAHGKKHKAEAGKKRQAAESSLSGGKAKKPKADVPSEPSASSKGGKKPTVRRWTIEDEIKILEAIVSHVKAHGTQPSAAQLIAAVGDSLERKNCSYTEMYEKVRSLKQRHEKAATAGTLPGNEDDLRKFNLSEAVWGKSAKEVAAALTISQNDAASSKSNKGQINKEKAKEAATTDTPVKSKKRGNQKGELEGDAKAADTAKETSNAATQNGGTSVRSKSEKPEKEGKNGDAESLGPKEAATTDTHEEKMDTDPNMGKGLDELQNLYPNLASYVESIQAQHPCGETLKRAFKFIADDKASALEAKIKKQRVAEMKMDIRRADTKKEVANIFIGLLN